MVYNSAISACEKKGKWTAALALLQKLQDEEMGVSRHGSVVRFGSTRPTKGHPQMTHTVVRRTVRASASGSVMDEGALLKKTVLSCRNQYPNKKRTHSEKQPGQKDIRSLQGHNPAARITSRFSSGAFVGLNPDENPPAK